MSTGDHPKHELRFTETNSADDSAGKTWGLEGNLFWFVAGGAFASVLTLLLLFSVWRWPLLNAAVRRLRWQRDAAARSFARHERGGEERDRLRSAFADGGILRLHGHHRGRALLRSLYPHGGAGRALVISRSAIILPA